MEGKLLMINRKIQLQFNWKLGLKIVCLNNKLILFIIMIYVIFLIGK